MLTEGLPHHRPSESLGILIWEERGVSSVLHMYTEQQMNITVMNITLELKEMGESGQPLDETHTQAITPPSPICVGAKCHEAVKSLWEDCFQLERGPRGGRSRRI